MKSPRPYHHRRYRHRSRCLRANHNSRHSNHNNVQLPTSRRSTSASRATRSSRRHRRGSSRSCASVCVRSRAVRLMSRSRTCARSSPSCHRSSPRSPSVAGRRLLRASRASPRLPRHSPRPNKRGTAPHRRCPCRTVAAAAVAAVAAATRRATSKSMLPSWSARSRWARSLPRARARSSSRSSRRPPPHAWPIWYHLQRASSSSQPLPPPRQCSTRTRSLNASTRQTRRHCLQPRACPLLLSLPRLPDPQQVQNPRSSPQAPRLIQTQHPNKMLQLARTKMHPLPPQQHQQHRHQPMTHELRRLWTSWPWVWLLWYNTNSGAKSRCKRP